MKKEMKRIFLRTTGGSFKQWIFFTDGTTEYGPIGAKQLACGRGGDEQADALVKNRGYREVTKDDYAKFMEAYNLLMGVSDLISGPQ